MIVVALFIAVVLLGVNSVSGGDNEESSDTLPAADEALIFTLQRNCFNNVPPLFFDDEGRCYSQDPTA